MYLSANTTSRFDPYTIQQKIDKAKDWSKKPLTARAECAVAAVAGSVTFLLFVFTAALA